MPRNFYELNLQQNSITSIQKNMPTFNSLFYFHDKSLLSLAIFSKIILIYFYHFEAPYLEGSIYIQSYLTSYFILYSHFISIQSFQFIQIILISISMNRSYSLTKTQCSYENLSSRINRLRSTSKQNLNYSSSHYSDARRGYNYRNNMRYSGLRNSYRMNENPTCQTYLQPQVGKVTKNTGIRKYNNRYTNTLNEVVKNRDMPLFESRLQNRLSSNGLSDYNIYKNHENIIIPHKHLIDEKSKKFRFHESPSNKSRSISRYSSHSRKSSNKKSKSSSYKNSRILENNDYVMECPQYQVKQYSNLIAGRVYSREDICKFLMVSH